MTELRGFGLALSAPPGWEVRMWRPDLPPPAENRPVVRLANVALPSTKNTYAEDVADDMRPGTLVASLAEFSPESAGRGLYGTEGVPTLRMDDLDPRAVQRALPGRSGAQRFFTVAGRAFSLYVIARDGAGLRSALRELDAALRGLVVEEQ